VVNNNVTARGGPYADTVKLRDFPVHTGTYPQVANDDVMSADVEGAALETDSITWGRLAGDGDERISDSYFGYQVDRPRHF